MDDSENRYEWIWSPPEGRLEDWLEERALRLVQDGEYDFTEWLKKAAEASDEVLRLVAEGKKPEFRRELWSQLKQHLFTIFHDLCAYCEADPLSTSSGDVEHYRPKARVAEDSDHPGYFWLAYDVSNFLPCCEQCNRVRGKRNFFPVEHGSRAYAADRTNMELPLLLHPYRDSYLDHMEFRADGYVRPLTRRGERSIRVYNLNRPNLVKRRCKVLENLQTDIANLTIKCGSLPEAFRLAVRTYERGECDFASARLQNVLRIMTEISGFRSSVADAPGRPADVEDPPEQPNERRYRRSPSDSGPARPGG